MTSTRRKPNPGLAAAIKTHQPGAAVTLRQSSTAIRFDTGEVDGERKEDRLKRLVSVITTAEGVAKETLRRTRQRFILEAGVALKAIHDEELWRLTHETFKQFVFDCWEYSEPYAYQMMEAVPVYAAVSAIAETTVINAEHIKILGPVVRRHGDEAAREVWTKAQDDMPGKPVTGAGLRHARRVLGYAKEEAEGERKTVVALPPATPLTTVGRATNSLKEARRLLSRKVIEQAVEEDPEAARVLMEELQATMATLRRIVGAG